MDSQIIALELSFEEVLTYKQMMEGSGYHKSNMLMNSRDPLTKLRRWRTFKTCLWGPCRAEM